MSQVIVFLSCKPTAGNHFLSGVMSLITWACFSFFMLLSLRVVSCVSLCPNKGCKHEQNVVKTFFLVSFSWFFMVICLFFSSFPSLQPITPEALQFASIKINGNTWRVVYSQIPRIPGYEVTRSLSCVSLMTFTARKWKYNPMLTKNHCGLMFGRLYVGRDYWGQSIFKVIFKSDPETERSLVPSLQPCFFLINIIFILWSKSKDLNAKCHCAQWENICNPLFFRSVLQSC